MGNVSTSTKSITAIKQPSGKYGGKSVPVVAEPTLGSLTEVGSDLRIAFTINGTPDGHLIYISTDSGNPVYAGYTEGSDNSFDYIADWSGSGSAPTVSSGTNYYAWVQAHGGDPTEYAPDPITDQTPATVLTAGGAPSAPSAPSSAAITEVSPTVASFSFTDNASNENGFIVERSVSGGSFSQIQTLGENAASPVLLAAVAGVDNQYRIRAYNAGGESANSTSNTITFSASGGSSDPAPSSISGTPGEGNTVTVNGTGFGAMGGDIIVASDFELNSAGTNLHQCSADVGGNWTAQYGYNGNNLEVDTTRAHSGTKSARVIWDDATIRAFGWAGRGPFTKLFLSYWRWQTGDYDHTETPTPNHKQFYVFGNDANGPYSQVPQFLSYIPGGNPYWGIYTNDSGANTHIPYADRHGNYAANYNNTYEEWQQWEYFIELNSGSGVKDGKAYWWLDGDELAGHDDWEHNRGGYEGQWVDWRLGHMAQRFTYSARAWFDEVYSASTQARIVISPSSTWAGRVGLDNRIQYAREADWSDTSIEFTWKGGTSGYLYVVGADGSVNAAGYAI